VKWVGLGYEDNTHETHETIVATEGGARAIELYHAHVDEIERRITLLKKRNTKRGAVTYFDDKSLQKKARGPRKPKREKANSVSSPIVSTRSTRHTPNSSNSNYSNNNSIAQKTLELSSDEEGMAKSDGVMDVEGEEDSQHHSDVEEEEEVERKVGGEEEEEEEEEKEFRTVYKQQPEFLGNDKLFSFQLTGLNFLHSAWENRNNVILGTEEWGEFFFICFYCCVCCVVFVCVCVIYCLLSGDEMGLGKTIQAIAYILSIRHELGDEGDFCPFLVVTPFSTVNNWLVEFRRWAPQLNVVGVFEKSVHYLFLLHYLFALEYSVSIILLFAIIIICSFICSHPQPMQTPWKAAS
jgi:SNF2 family DNA or RNA helicase